MEMKDVLVLLTNKWADWEAAYAIAEVNSVPEYAVKTIALDSAPKVSIGGVRAAVDYELSQYRDFSRAALLILPGGFSWGESKHEEIAAFIAKAIEAKVPVAAICGSTIFLGRHGFLDKVKHTGDDLDLFLKEPGYGGKDFYVAAQVVTDKGLITANETAAVEFAYEIFKLLKIDEPAELDRWFDNFKRGMARECPE
ncbi:glutamine amidotransferase [Deltaproteobacteria bacterium Smac51]|nr:glutamine amidotransferase [Deltaproteobacteria bacterium Smac51]